MIGSLALATTVAMGGGGQLANAGCDVPGGHSAVLLGDGRVLVMVTPYAAPTRSAIYDPVTGSWTTAAVPAGGQEATVLADGRVLITGVACGIYLPQLYDPRTGSSSPTGAMLGVGACGDTATLLTNGKVLVTGGGACQQGGPSAAAQLYDPALNTWSAAASLSVPRAGHKAVRLADGRVLVVGGIRLGNGDQPRFLTSAEIYDPASNVWSPAGEMTTNGGRYDSYVLSLVGNGMVLAAGGCEDGLPATSAELFDPATDRWSPTSRMSFGRSGASATRLEDGRVLVLGGLGVKGAPLTSGEIYDPGTQQWVLAPATLTAGSFDQTAILLRAGRIFVTRLSDQWSSGDVELYDVRQAGSPPTPTPAVSGPGTWSWAAAMAAPYTEHTATLLADGRVLVIGTGAGATAGIAVELYAAAPGRWSAAAKPASISPSGFTATLLSSGRVLLIDGGAELYDPTADRWSPAAPMRLSRFGHTATLLTDGRVLVAGGSALVAGQPDVSGGYLKDAEIYNPNSNQWSAAALMLVAGCAGCSDTATRLRDGRVLEVLGYGVSAEIYDPKSDSWSSAGRLNKSHELHTATLLPNGRVLVAGGFDRGPGVSLAAAEIYDPASNSWSLAAPMLEKRQAHTATLLPNGLVLVAGGYGSDSAIASAELYDPVADRWAPTSSMTVARTGHTATLLRTGTVLVAGGSFLGNLRSTELYAPTPASANPSASQGALPTVVQAAPGPAVTGSFSLATVIRQAGIPLAIVALLVVATLAVLARRTTTRKRRG